MEGHRIYEQGGSESDAAMHRELYTNVSCIRQVRRLSCEVIYNFDSLFVAVIIQSLDGMVLGKQVK